MLKSEIKKT